MRRRRLFLLLCALLAAPAAGGGGSAPSFHTWSLDLPGAPAAVIPADLNGDGLTDLVVVVAYTAWDQIGIAGKSEVDEVKGLVESLTVIPALVERREVRAFLARPGGGYQELPEPLPLPLSVLSMEAGPPGLPVVALTDAGVSALSLVDGRLRLDPVIDDPPVLAGTGAFVANLGLVQDVSGDGIPDLLLPGKNGLAVYLGKAGGGLARQPAGRFPVPGECYGGDPEGGEGADLVRHYPLPVVGDVDGDGLPDLAFADPVAGWRHTRVLINRRHGRFWPAVELTLGSDSEGAPAPVFFGDLDGDGVAELVTREDLDAAAKSARGGRSSLRQDLQQANEPRSRLRFYHLDRDLEVAKAPYLTVEVSGYAFAGESETPLGGFRDLNGDGRLDLATVTLDLSAWKAMRSLLTKRMSVDVQVHLWCQAKDGRFRAARGGPPASTFRFDLNDLRLGQLALFADLDGDGRAGFVQLGGRQVA
ncbi:MAG TPA: VCBS repeat-containing protein, partial [Thermoanaerobaculia bacterium]|nr:VCBS repeat-containing protein [Thermoanaerobaculia bacterium]